MFQMENQYKYLIQGYIISPEGQNKVAAAAEVIFRARQLLIKRWLLNTWKLINALLSQADNILKEPQLSSQDKKSQLTALFGMFNEYVKGTQYDSRLGEYFGDPKYDKVWRDYWNQIDSAYLKRNDNNPAALLEAEFHSVETEMNNYINNQLHDYGDQWTTQQFVQLLTAAGTDTWCNHLDLYCNLNRHSKWPKPHNAKDIELEMCAACCTGMCRRRESRRQGEKQGMAIKGSRFYDAIYLERMHAYASNMRDKFIVTYDGILSTTFFKFWLSCGDAIRSIIISYATTDLPLRTVCKQWRTVSMPTFLCNVRHLCKRKNRFWLMKMPVLRELVLFKCYLLLLKRGEVNSIVRKYQSERTKIRLNKTDTTSFDASITTLTWNNEARLFHLHLIKNPWHENEEVVLDIDIVRCWELLAHAFGFVLPTCEMKLNAQTDKHNITKNHLLYYHLDNPIRLPYWAYDLGIEEQETKKKWLHQLRHNLKNNSILKEKVSKLATKFDVEYFAAFHQHTKLNWHTFHFFIIPEFHFFDTFFRF